MTPLSNAALDALSRLPYFRGKGTLALGTLLLSRSPDRNTARLPNGGRMRLGLDAMHQSLLPYWIGKYEREIVQTFLQSLARLEPLADVIDIGANLGFYTVLAAESLRQRGSGLVHSFEPNPRIFAELQQNVALNAFTNVKLQCVGVGDITSEMTLYVNENAATYSSLRRTHDFLSDEIHVPVTTLDEYSDSNRVKKVGLVKVDVEGGELLVFKGGLALLRRDHPIVVYEEFDRGYQHFGYSARDVRDYLTDIGYQLFAIHAGNGAVPRLRLIGPEEIDPSGYQNVLAVPESTI